jgi:hypothetical protein
VIKTNTAAFSFAGIPTQLTGHSPLPNPNGAVEKAKLRKRVAEAFVSPMQVRKHDSIYPVSRAFSEENAENCRLDG